MSTIFKSGLYSTFSNSTIMNKNKEVSHFKQETISVFFTHSSLNQASAPQNIVWLIWPNRKFQNNKQYISQFWFFKLTKQIKYICRHIYFIEDNLLYATSKLRHV